MNTKDLHTREQLQTKQDKSRNATAVPIWLATNKQSLSLGLPSHRRSKRLKSIVVASSQKPVRNRWLSKSGVERRGKQNNFAHVQTQLTLTTKKHKSRNCCSRSADVPISRTHSQVQRAPFTSAGNRHQLKNYCTLSNVRKPRDTHSAAPHA